MAALIRLESLSDSALGVDVADVELVLVALELVEEEDDEDV